jgi:hypothetical protein
MYTYPHTTELYYDTVWYSKTNEEAIDLLAHGAGLDSRELPAAMLEVVGLCGRLPLCVNIASRIIADHGENWQTEALPEMRKGFSQFAGDDGANAESVQDSIIVASLASIVGKDADRIKRLFISSSCFGEDQRVPGKLFVVLWSAAVKAAAQDKKRQAVKAQISASDAKRMVTTLVRRSLFLELTRGSIQLHDIGACAFVVCLFVLILWCFVVFYGLRQYGIMC